MPPPVVLEPKTEGRTKLISVLPSAAGRYYAVVPRAAGEIVLTSGKVSRRRIRLRISPSGRMLKVFVTQRLPSQLPVMQLPTRPEDLKFARYTPPSSIELRFADKTFSLAVKLLGMPVDRIRWPSAAALPTGEAMTVKGVKGENIPIDSSTLRYLVDPKYAAKVDAELKSLQFSRAELKEMASGNPLPDELRRPSERDLTSDSWK